MHTELVYTTSKTIYAVSSYKMQLLHERALSSKCGIASKYTHSSIGGVAISLEINDQKKVHISEFFSY